MKPKSLAFILLLIVVGCADAPKVKESTPEPAPDPMELVAAKIDALCPDLAGLPSKLHHAKLVNEFYNAARFIPVWTDHADTLLHFVAARGAAFGLDTNVYHLKALRTLRASADDPEKAAAVDVLCTDAWFALAHHLHEGRLDTVGSIYALPRRRLTAQLPELLSKASSDNTHLQSLLQLQPVSIHYTLLQNAFEEWLNGRQLHDSSIQVCGFKVDSALAYSLARKALILQGYLSKDSTKTRHLKSAIKTFQGHHGLTVDGVVGTNTALALSKTPNERYRQTVAALERWRWKSDWEPEYLFVNIPSFELQAWKSDSVVRTHRVIVGNPRAQTPEINSHIQHIIAYPFWHVPNGIATKELLPKIKRDSTFIDRNGYQILSRSFRVQDHKKIDFSKLSVGNFPYHIRQKGGNTNALGVVKFIFPNEHMVYLHDTPSKPYFRNEIRAYSHGCIRLQHPLDLAEFLLKEDENEFQIADVHGFIKNEQRKKIVLNDSVPVHIHYITAAGNNNGELLFYPDVYGLDEQLIQLLFPTDSAELQTGIITQESDLP